MPPPTESPRVGGVILAAGASRRMGEGRNKMLLELEGESLVRRAARRALAAGLSPVVVVLGHEAERVRAELSGLACDCTVNPDFTGPTSGSLHKGLERLGPEVAAAVVMLGDMVLVSEQMLGALVAAARRTAAPLVVSRYGDVTAPPLLFRRVLFPELLAWTGEGCGKTVVQRHREEAVYVDWPPAALTDVDTPEDFRAAQAQLHQEDAMGRPAKKKDETRQQASKPLMSLYPPSEADIRRRAYEIFERRGRTPGHELEDWLQAKRELGVGE